MPGTKSQAELLADVDDGLLVQEVSGLHSGVNPISGDFSTGAPGMLISNGEVGAPVRELTIAPTLQRMLLDVVAIGNDVDWLSMRRRRQPRDPRGDDVGGMTLLTHEVAGSASWLPVPPQR